MSRLTAYLAGPDVFLPDAPQRAACKIALCERYGLHALAPLTESGPGIPAWRRIVQANIAMMEASDLVIANLTPFRGASADAGTLVELGWFSGRGRPVFGYSNCATPFAVRSRAYTGDCMADAVPGTEIEDFGLPDNLMVPGLLEPHGMEMVLPEGGQDLEFVSLEVFERCVARVAALCGRKG